MLHGGQRRVQRGDRVYYKTSYVVVSPSNGSTCSSSSTQCSTAVDATMTRSRSSNYDDTFTSLSRGSTTIQNEKKSCQEDATDDYDYYCDTTPAPANSSSVPSTPLSEYDVCDWNLLVPNACAAARAAGAAHTERGCVLLAPVPPKSIRGEHPLPPPGPRRQSRGSSGADIMSGASTHGTSSSASTTQVCQETDKNHTETN